LNVDNVVFRDYSTINSMRFRILFILIISSLIIMFSPQIISAQTLPTIGANLEAYQPPTGNECNINVPSQYPTIQAGIDASSNGERCVLVLEYTMKML